MGIVRNDPFMNLDTRQTIKFSNVRLTRAQVHRILKANGIQHNHNGTLNYMLDLCETNNIPIIPVQPGQLEVKPKLSIVKEEKKEEKPKEVKLAKDGFPQLVPVLKTWCKDRNIPIKRDDKRADLIQRLKEYQENPHGYTP